MFPQRIFDLPEKKIGGLQVSFDLFQKLTFIAIFSFNSPQHSEFELDIGQLRRFSESRFFFDFSNCDPVNEISNRGGNCKGCHLARIVWGVFGYEFLDG